jgi:hypothetical protein
VEVFEGVMVGVLLDINVAVLVTEGVKVEVNVGVFGVLLIGVAVFPGVCDGVDVDVLVDV